MLSKFQQEAKSRVQDLAAEYGLDDYAIYITTVHKDDGPPKHEDELGPDMEDIARSICDFYNLPYNEVFSLTQKQPNCVIRQVVFYILMNYTEHGCYKIGRKFGRTHATVIHGEKVIRNLMDVDKNMRSEVNYVVDIILKTYKNVNNDISSTAVE